MNWKVLVISFAALLAIGIGVTSIVTSQNEFKVEHKEAVPQTQYEDGRYQAGSPEQYWVDPAPAYMWELTKSKTWRTVSFVVLILISVYLGLCGAGIVAYKHGYFFGGLVLCAATWLAGFASAFENNTKKLNPSQYEQVKDNLKSLWSKETYIR